MQLPRPRRTRELHAYRDDRSNLVADAQQFHRDSPLAYGQSITDACLSCDETVPVLEGLAAVVAKRRDD